jgi:hypothetical protein
MKNRSVSSSVAAGDERRPVPATIAAATFPELDQVGAVDDGGESIQKAGRDPTVVAARGAVVDVNDLLGREPVQGALCAGVHRSGACTAARPR